MLSCLKEREEEAALEEKELLLAKAEVLAD